MSRARFASAGALVHARSVARRLESSAEDSFLASSQYASDFLMGTSPVHRALTRLVTTLDEEGIPHAIVGALALGEYGYRRTTEDVDVLLRPDGLATFKEHHLGRGWVEKFPGSRGMRDTETGVEIDVLLTGDYPGDGKPKPVSFPDPEQVARRGEKVSLLPLPNLVELKLASGMSAPHRLRDLADVLELIEILGLDEAFADQLDPYVREKYAELLAAARTRDSSER